MQLLPVANLVAFLCGFLTPSRAYDLVRAYEGATFFDNWDFYGSYDNLTLGNVKEKILRRHIVLKAEFIIDRGR